MNRLHEVAERGKPQGFNRLTSLGRAREDAGMTQKQLADATGIRQASISRYENGLFEPRVGHAILIARALGKPVEEVFGDAK